MSRCNDKRFENMLHAWEMGMLSDEDCKAFEIHLLSCQHCFELAGKLEAAADLMRDDEDVKQVPGDVLDEVSATVDIAGESEEKSESRTWPRYISLSLAAAAVVVFLILKPWQIEIKPGSEATAAENRLAIMYFDNMATPGDPQRMGEITTSLLITDLSESRYVQVVSSQRLYDILMLLGEEKSSLSDSRISTKVAAKANAKWMLTGNILQMEPYIVLNSQIVEVASGDVIASQQVNGEAGDDIFAMVDRLTVIVKNDLSLPVAAQQEPDRRVADVTTNSPLAYRYYLEGMVNYHRYYNADAVKSFRKALEVDTTFAMAYYYLSLIDEPALIAKAVEFSDKAGKKDRYFIRSQAASFAGDIDQAIRELQQVLELYPDDKEAYFRIGVCYGRKLEFETAVHYFGEAVEIDPLYKIVYNQMAYTYDWMGKYEKSVEAIDMYVSLAPEEANPYDSRGDIYTNNGKLELAIESYKQALNIKPDFWASLYKYGKNHLFLGNYEIADSCFNALSECDDRPWRANGMAARAYVPISQGRFDDAIAILDKGIAAYASETGGDEYPLFHYLKAVAYYEKKDLGNALRQFEESIRTDLLISPDDKIYNRHFVVQVLSESGNIDKAEELTETLRKDLGPVLDTLRYWYAVASIDLAKGNIAQAVAGFEKAAEDTVIPYTPANCMLAVAYYEAGQWQDVIDELEEFLRVDFTDARLYHGGWVARAHYLMGLAYEELGQANRAIDQYQVFLDLWKSADAGLIEVDDARARLTRLQTKS